MKHDLELKVQAWLDGELPEREARRTGEWIARDSEASKLAAELGCVRQAILRNESSVVLEESRDFYWSKIARQIQQEGSPGRPESAPWYAHLRRYLAPVVGALALACVTLMVVRQGTSPTFDEISSTGEGMEAVTFHDQSAQMTVVWLQDSSTTPAEDKPAPKNIRYEDEPGTVIDLE